MATLAQNVIVSPEVNASPPTSVATSVPGTGPAGPWMEPLIVFLNV